MDTKYKIFTAGTQAYFQEAQKLMYAYQQYLGIDLEFQGFTAEMQTLPQMYGPPKGVMFLVERKEAVIGCAGLRDFGKNIAEMKRMYVRPEHQGKGIGKALTQHLISSARKLGYNAIRLDSLPWMKTAIAMYRKFGFVEIPSYRYNPNKDTVYLELKL